MKKTLLFSIFLTLTVFSGTAQKSWSLEDCINYAWENNLSIKSSALNTESQKIRLEQAKNKRLPDLNASLYTPLNYGLAATANGTNEGSGEFTTSVSGSIGSSVTLFSGFQIKNNIAAQGFNLQASIEDLKKAKESMAVSISSSYLQVLYNKEMQTISEEQVKLSNELLERSKVQAEYGKIPEGQVYEAKAQLSKDKQSSTESLNTLKLSLLDLSQMLELKDWATFDIVVPTINLQTLSTSIPTADEVYTYAINNKPEVKASEYRLKSSEKSLEVSKSGYYPTVSLSASYGNGYYPSSKTYDTLGIAHRIPFNTQLKSNYSAGVSLSVSIPIFNRFDTKNNIRLSNIELENAKITLENSKKTLYKEIQQAWFNAKSAMEKYQASADVVMNSLEAFRFSEEKYTNGKSTVYEFNQAKLNLANAKSNQLQAKYNLLFCVKILDFYKGEPLKL
jgi:outer membrane protein